MAGNIRHWKERNGRYSARIVIPVNLRPFLENKSELEIQLGGDKRTALRNHAAAVASLQKQIGIARQKHEAATGQVSNPLPYPMTARQIALRDYQSQIAFDEEIRAHDHRYAQIDPDPVYDAHPYRDGFAGRMSDDELERLVGAQIESARISGNTSAVKGTTEWRTIAQALCVASYEAVARRYERNDGDFNGAPTHPILVKAEAEAATEAQFVSFDTIIDDEVKRRARGKDAKPLPDRTAKKYRDDCKAFCKWRKNKNALTVTAAEGKAWIEQMQDAGALGNRTIKARFQNVRTVINWGRSNDPANFFPAGNPLTGVKLPDYQTTPSHLRAYTMDEASRVLTAARKETRPLFRWLPWLCAYSGMRVSEAGALLKEDFFKVGERWFWKVTTAGGRKLKNASSERRIPVHPALVAEGLIDFVEDAPAGRLFKGETKDEIDVQPRMSSWVREIITLEEHPELSPNHGWRHLFEDLCRRDRVPEEARHYMTGRTDGNSQELYGRSEVMLPGLAAAMDEIKPIPIKQEN
ncbi:integrase [Ochrobactrum sp. SD129]|nr:integrase [Ochrobactrum sp. SD129]